MVISKLRCAAHGAGGDLGRGGARARGSAGWSGWDARPGRVRRTPGAEATSRDKSTHVWALLSQGAHQVAAVMMHDLHAARTGSQSASQHAVDLYFSNYASQLVDSASSACHMHC